MSWVIRKQSGDLVYAAVIDGKRIGWGSRKAAEARRAELELYYMWAFDAVVEEIEDEADADGAEAMGPEAGRGEEEPSDGAAKEEAGE